jgi:hypothetical protein
VPRKAKSHKAICAMPFDNIQIGEYGIMVDEVTVLIDKQRTGEPREAAVTLPRWVFDRFVDWYERGIIPREEKRDPYAR